MSEIDSAFIDLATGPIIQIKSWGDGKGGAQIRTTTAASTVYLTLKDTERLIDALIDTLPESSVKRLRNILLTIAPTISRHPEQHGICGCGHPIWEDGTHVRSNTVCPPPTRD